MQRKNDRFLRIVAFTCTTILSFHPLFAVYRSTGKRLAAARQSSAVVAPKPVVAPVAAAPEEEIIKPIAAKKEQERLEEENDAQAAQEETEENAEETDLMEVQNTLPAPTGFLSAAYAIVTPLILVTLNAAVGTAIEAGTKSLLSGFVDRPELLEKRDLAEEKDLQLTLKLFKKYPDQIKSGNLDDIPEKELKSWSKNRQLIQQLDQSTSVSYIFNKAAYTFMVFTIFNMLAKISGYSASVTLDTLLQKASPTPPQVSKQKN